MAVISSTAGMQAVTQAAFQQLKLQQARQNADRAEQVARALQTKAAAAQQVADQAQEDARSLTVQSSRAQNIAGQARQGVAMVESVGEMQTRLSGTIDRVAQMQVEVPVPEVTSPVPGNPVINTSGQATGTLVNTTA